MRSSLVNTKSGGKIGYIKIYYITNFFRPYLKAFPVFNVPETCRV